MKASFNVTLAKYLLKFQLIERRDALGNF